MSTEDRIVALEAQVAALSARLQSHDRKFCRLYEVVYQVLGRIYNRITELDYIYNYWNYMVFNRHHDDGIDTLPSAGGCESDSDLEEDTDEDNDSV